MNEFIFERRRCHGDAAEFIRSFCGAEVSPVNGAIRSVRLTTSGFRELAVRSNLGSSENDVRKSSSRIMFSIDVRPVQFGRMKLYTKTGDDGTTGLFGGGWEVGLKTRWRLKRLQARIEREQARRGGEQ